jgi:transcriptional regulator with XRE-family HTH domain
MIADEHLLAECRKRLELGEYSCGSATRDDLGPYESAIVVRRGKLDDILVLRQVWRETSQVSPAALATCQQMLEDGSLLFRRSGMMREAVKNSFRDTVAVHLETRLTHPDTSSGRLSRPVMQPWLPVEYHHLGMEANPPSLRRLAELLRNSLGQVGVTMFEVERRMGWKDGTLSRALSSGVELKVGDLLEVLKAAGIEERSFFASLYDLEPRCRSVSEKGEIPYSTGHLSEEDAPNFPPFEEVLSLFHNLMENALQRENLAEEPEPSFFGEADLLDRSIPED